MSSRFVVEVDGRAVGLALRCQGGYRFFASEPRLHILEGALFPHSRALLHAVRFKDRLLLGAEANMASRRGGSSRQAPPG